MQSVIQGSASGSRKSGFRDRDPEKRRRDGIGMGKLNPEISGRDRDEEINKSGSRNFRDKNI